MTSRTKFTPRDARRTCHGLFPCVTAARDLALVVRTIHGGRVRKRIRGATISAPVTDACVCPAVHALDQPSSSHPFRLAAGRRTVVRATVPCHAALTSAATTGAHVTQSFAALRLAGPVQQAVRVLAEIAVAARERCVRAGGITAGVEPAETEDGAPRCYASVPAERHRTRVVRAEGAP